MTLKKTLLMQREALGYYAIPTYEHLPPSLQGNVARTALSTPTPDLTPLEEVIRAAEALRKDWLITLNSPFNGKHDGWDPDSLEGALFLALENPAIKELMGE